MKKGQAEAQFNWIFALVAGALILSLIVGFMFRQQQISQDKANEDNLREFQGVLSALKLTEERVETIKLDPGVSFGVDYKSNVLIMGKAQAEITTDVVASPRSLTGRELDAWTKPVMMPAHITNVVFLSPSYRHYVFVANNVNDPDVKEFYGLFPDSINKMLATAFGTDATVQNILQQPDAKIRIVYINMPVQNKAALAPKRISEISLNLSSGTVTFGTKRYPLYYNSDMKSIMPQIAVLVDNGDDYNVTVTRIFDRGEEVYKILRLRAAQLSNIYQWDCRDIFSQAISPFTELENSRNVAGNYITLKSYYDEAESAGCANLY